MPAAAATVIMPEPVKPTRRRTNSRVQGLDLEVVKVTSSSFEPAPTRLKLLRLAVPEVVRPSTRDLNLAQEAAADITRAIQATEDNLGALASIEIKLRIEMERAEDLLKKQPAPSGGLLAGLLAEEPAARRVGPGRCGGATIACSASLLT